MRRRISFFSYVILPLLLGGGIYLLFRSSQLLMFAWAAMLGLMEPLAQARAVVAPWQAMLPAWAIFSLPTALYYLSAMNYCWLMLEQDRTMAWRWTLLVSGLAFGVELIQTILPLAGTFSSEDLVTYAFVFPLSLPFRALLLSERIQA